MKDGASGKMIYRRDYTPYPWDVSRLELFFDIGRETTLVCAEMAFQLKDDSGGVQEEGPSLGKPVLVVRNVTERPEAVEAGTAMLIGQDKQTIKHWIKTMAIDAEFREKMSRAINPYGDGSASSRIVQATRFWLGRSNERPSDFEVLTSR